MNAGGDRRIALARIHAAALLAGFSGLFAKLLPCQPVAITCGRAVFGSLAIFLLLQFRRERARPSSGRVLLWLAVSGALLAAHWIAFFRSIQLSTVAIGLLAFSSFPLFVTLLEPFFFSERLHAYDLLTACAVVAGLGWMTPALDLANPVTQGIAWGVLSGLLYALLSLGTRFVVREAAPLQVTLFQQAFAALFTLPFLSSGGLALTGRSLLLLLLLGVVFTALAQSLLVFGLRHVRAQAASVIISLEPVYGALFAYLLLRETPALRTVLGGVLIGGAVLAASCRHLALPTAAPSSHCLPR